MVRRLARLLLLAAVPGLAQTGPRQVPDETARLMAAARLWTTVKYFHPYVVTSDIDWDGALVSALPKIRSAASAEEFRSALSGMLDQLHDPATHVLPDPKIEHSQESPAAQWSLVRTAEGVSFLVTPQPANTKSVQLDLEGVSAVVRMSESYAATPVIHHPAPPGHDAYPNTELRLLSAIKIWGAIHYFFAYKDLMDEDWDDVFAGYLSKFTEAHDAIDYNLTVADLLTHLTDTNTLAHSSTLDTYFGEAPVGLDIRLLEKYPIVSAVLDPAATAAGVHAGDVVKRIGNESTTDRFRRLVQYVPASTPQRSGYDTIQRIANGPAGSQVELLIENAKGEAHALKLTRAFRPIAPQRRTESVRILPGNIGYLDLDRLPEDGVEDALKRLMNTRAVIFDLRGCAAAAATVARHLTAQSSLPVALVNTPFAVHPDIAVEGSALETTTSFNVRTMAPPLTPLYKGKTIALIDERTIGRAEYAGALFQAANKTEFVGAPTAGAESRIAELALPGGIMLTYSAEDIRLGNGGKLQRLGLQPNVPAATTAKGLRADRDEVLEAAVAYLGH